MTAAQGEMCEAAYNGDIYGIIACGRGNPRLLVEGLDVFGGGRTALYLASRHGQVKGS